MKLVTAGSLAKAAPVSPTHPVLTTNQDVEIEGVAAAGDERSGENDDQEVGADNAENRDDGDWICEPCDNPEDVEKQRIAPTPYLPTRSEIEDHRCTHIPFSIYKITVR